MMELTVIIDKVKGGYEIAVEHVTPTTRSEENAVASTARQAGIRAGELVRKLVEAEYVKVANP